MALGDLILPAVAAGAGAVGVSALLWAFFVRYYVAVPPNRALVLFGRRSLAASRASGSAPTLSERRPKFVVGGGRLLLPWSKGFNYLPLNALDVDASAEAVAFTGRTAGQIWEVRIGAQVKIPAEEGALRAASESLLGLSDEEIRTLARRAIEGSVPGILARVAAEEFENDWERLAAEIHSATAAEVVQYGLIVRSLTVREFATVGRRAGELPTTQHEVAPVHDLLPTQTDMLDRLHRFEVRIDRLERALGTLDEEIVRLSSEDDVSMGVRSPTVIPPLSSARTKTVGTAATRPLLNLEK